MTALSRSAGFAIPAALLLLAASAPALAARSATPAVKVSTKTYVFSVSVGMPEQMWTAAQVKAKHPKTGEVMLMGSMGGAMSMGGSQRHVEVHIAKRASGKVVAGAHPTITVLDTTAKGSMSVKVPVAEMQGVTEGPSDIHYGNNVDLVGGHAYRVTVVLAGERAVATITAPK